jgi:hypothetical protein
MAPQAQPPLKLFGMVVRVAADGSVGRVLGVTSYRQRGAPRAIESGRYTGLTMRRPRARRYGETLAA